MGGRDEVEVEVEGDPFDLVGVFVVLLVVTLLIIWVDVDHVIEALLILPIAWDELVDIQDTVVIDELVL